jgi:hypothetical protein
MSALAHLRSSVGWLVGLFRAALSALRARREVRPSVMIKSPIKRTAEGLDRDGAVVFARATGWPHPPVINGYRPHVYAVYDDREVALSFTTEENVEEPVSERQTIAFAAWAEEAPEREFAQIVVPGERR